MTRADAEERARWLQEHDPDRETHRFVARESAAGEWEVARVEIPTADDPRTGNERRLPGLPGGL